MFRHGRHPDPIQEERDHMATLFTRHAFRCSAVLAGALAGTLWALPVRAQEPAPPAPPPSPAIAQEAAAPEPAPGPPPAPPARGAGGRGARAAPRSAARPPLGDGGPRGPRRGGDRDQAPGLPAQED